MEQHAGAHPRIGAVDVIPFVPLGATRLEECVDLARRFGEQIATRFELPVYLYGAAALRPERARLADVRRGQYEAIRDEIGADPARAPDFGPTRIHPRGGAVAVGARKPLIAFNINLRDRRSRSRASRSPRRSASRPAACPPCRPWASCSRTRACRAWRRSA